jgi:exodeoxyribonuclease VII small subunit
MSEAQPEVGTLSYEQALAELEQVIKRLETGSIELADSIAWYERGTALAARCGELLEATERKVERLVLGPRGELSEVPLADAEDEA